MSYDTVDVSVRDGAPIECYKFIGELKNYFYTNNNVEVTVAGDEYLPLSGIKRGPIETSSLLDSNQTIDVILPITCELAVTYNFLKMPLTLDLEIRSVHRGTNFATESKLIWQGQSVGFPVAQDDASISTQSVIQAALSRQLNQVVYQTSCNHEVYDELCTLDPADFTTTAIVENIKDSVIRVSATGRSDGTLAIGKMVNTRTGENRVIIGNIGKIVTVGYGFLDIEVGDTVDLILGCNNSYTACTEVFNNIINFLGFKFAPNTNPYVNKV